MANDLLKNFASYHQFLLKVVLHHNQKFFGGWQFELGDLIICYFLLWL